MSARWALAVAIAAAVLASGGAHAEDRSEIVAGVDAFEFAYDAARGHIVATGQVDFQPPQVIWIDPASADVTGRLTVGDSPSAPAVSDDGSTLYVALRPDRVVQTVDLATRTPLARFAVGVLDIPPVQGIRLAPFRIAVLPGDANAVAVVRADFSGHFAGVAVFDSGVMRPNQSPGVTSLTDGSTLRSMAFDAENRTLYVREDLSLWGVSRLRRVRIDADGATEDLQAVGEFGTQDEEIRFAAGRLWSDGGEVIDAATLTSLPGFATAAPVLPAPASGLAYRVEGGLVVEYDLSTLAWRGSMRFGDEYSTSPVHGFAGAGPQRFVFRSSGVRIVESTFDGTPSFCAARWESGTGALMGWSDDNRDGTGVEIERSVAGGPFTPLATVAPGQQGYVDDLSGVAAALTDYRYRFRVQRPAGPTPWSEVVGVRTPSNVQMGVDVGRMVDSPRALRDKVVFLGRAYPNPTFMPDPAFDPRVDGVRITVGPGDGALVVDIPPNDGRWRTRLVAGRRFHYWRSRRRDVPKALVVFAAGGHRFGFVTTGFDFAGPLANPVAFTLRVGNDAGVFMEEWKEKRPGDFRRRWR